jgi:NADPH-dependent 2,4-dienoyl-CoA reductase/sulfur reductase-like enzyme
VKRIAIVGAGPAGLQAAIAAAQNGVEVTLIDGNTQPGGQYYRQPPANFRPQAPSKHQEKAAALIARLDHDRINYLSQTRVLSISADGRKMWLHRGHDLWEFEATAVILATGAYDRPAAFPGWTLPGVMSVGAAQTAIKGQRVLPGKKILLAGTGPLLLAAGANLVWGGAEVAFVLEASNFTDHITSKNWSALWGQWPRLREGANYLLALRKAGAVYRTGWSVIKALGTAEEGVTGAVIAPLDGQWQPLIEKAEKVECDTICIGYGFIPETALGRLAGAAHGYQNELGGWVPQRDPFLQTSVSGLYAVGDGAGIGGAVLSELEGRLAGTAASLAQDGEHKPEFKRKLKPQIKGLEKERKFQKLYSQLFTPQPGMHSWAQEDTVICRCENVNRAAIESAVVLGAQTINEVKGLTRAGMGSCQGRLCSHLVAGQIARLTGKLHADCGLSSIRPPINPLALADVTGRGPTIEEGGES